MAKGEEAAKQLPRVLVLRPPPMFKMFEKEFSEKFQFLKAWESPIPTDQFLAAEASSIEAMLTSGSGPVTPDILRHLPSVRIIVTSSVGVNHIDLQECRSRGIAVAAGGDVVSEDVADTAVALLIDVIRGISASDRYVRGGLWPIKGEYPHGSKLGGKRVGIVGLGNIGLEVAKRLEAFGCPISYNSRKNKPSISFPFYHNVCDLASNCDILVICCALTDKTHHMINKQVLAALGKEGVIVNIARGSIIDEKELVRCLVQGEIAGAGLDVFENEPEVPREFFAMDNVVLSPHRAVSTEESSRAKHELISGNLDAFFSNKPLLSQLGGKRVGIIGLGSIGLEVAKRLDAFGCTISYNSTKKKPHVAFPFYHNVLDLATNCNVLVICCALTDQTHHMINKEVLLALGKKGTVINIARGSVIDEKELVQCLVRGEIAGAGLDVFENEPEVPKELFELDNVVMSPHRAVFTEESFNDLCELMAGNLEAFFSNKPLLSPVD